MKKPEVAVPGYDARQAPINAKLGQDEKIALYRDMVRIRRFEERWKLLAVITGAQCLTWR